LLFSHDLQLAKDIQGASKIRVEPLKVYPCSNGRNFAEYGHQHQFAAVLFDEAFHDPNSADWVRKLRAGLSVQLGNQNAPVILLGAERDLDGVEKLLWQDYADLITKPVDLSFLFQKLQIALGSTRLLKEDLLFSLDVTSSLQVSIATDVLRASEYSVVLRGPVQFQTGETLRLQSPMFGENSLGVWARVVSSQPRAGEDHFESRLSFLGPSRSTLTAVRLWLKKQYIDAHAVSSDTTTRAKVSVESSIPGRVNPSRDLSKPAPKGMS
jgi:DNA-binding response OmpR family regulator